MAETGIIFDLKKFAIHDGPGIRTTVFFKGCPLHCQWCHNPESRCHGVEQFPVAESDHSHDRGHVTIGREVTVDEIMNEIAKDEIFYDESGGGVTFSGGEPTCQPEFLTALLDTCRASHYHTALDTCGQVAADRLLELVRLTDLVLYDLKLIDDNKHIEYVGVSNQLILQNLVNLASVGANVMIRVPIIPGYTDTVDNIEGLVSFLAPYPSLRTVSLLPYNRFGEDKRHRFGLPRTPEINSAEAPERIMGIARLLEEHGHTVTIGG